MSLILEALKRSEAERHSGRDVAPLPPSGNAGHGPGRTSLWVAGALVIGVGIVAASWYQGNPEQASAVDASVDTPQPPTPGVAASRPANDVSPLGPVVDIPPEDIEQASDGPGTSEEHVAETPDPVLPGAAVEPGEQASDAPLADALAAEQSIEPQAVVNSPPPAAPVLVDLTMPPAALAPLPSHDNQDQSADPRLPTLGQLPSSARSEIGDLTLNIHVYDDRPEDRFVLINLRRYTEGDNLNGDLIVRQIRPDGVVMALRGQDFLLPSGS